MITRTVITISVYQRRDRQAVLDLAFQSNLVHTHLDWHEVSAWLETPNVPIRLAWQQGRVVGVMATSPPLNNTCWLRLIAISEDAPAGLAMRLLWENIETAAPHAVRRAVRHAG